jgi:DNA gyrase subunit B
MTSDTPDSVPQELPPKQSQKVENEYGADAIQVLEGLEAVRKRPGMYIGSTGERGLHHLVYEIVDNSVDEALAGYATPSRHDPRRRRIRVVDNGRGIPVDIHTAEGKSTVEVVLTVLHAGGKFGGGGYAVSGGLHGVGSSVVNALSTRLDVEVRRQGHVWRQSFATAVCRRPAEPGRATDETGTTITFWPDDGIFETIDFDYDTLRTRFQQTAFLNKGLRITLSDLRPSSAYVVDGEDGGRREAAARRLPLRARPRRLRRVPQQDPQGRGRQRRDHRGRVRRHRAAHLARARDAVDDELHRERLHLREHDQHHEGGTHEEGFRAALTTSSTSTRARRACSRRRTTTSRATTSARAHRRHLGEAVRAAVRGQTKTKLGNTEAKAFVQKVVGDQLTDWLDRNPAQAKRVIMKAIDAATARLAARKARETARRKSVFESAPCPTSSRTARARTRRSARSSSSRATRPAARPCGRDPRRRRSCAARQDPQRREGAPGPALGNNEIQAMISAFGTGIGEDFDVEKARYHKIVLMADADVDGQHITTLLLTLLFRYMRGLIEAGFVYLAMPPLYRLKWSNAEHEYVFSDRERDALLADGLANGKRIPKDNGIQRYKGLGEMNAEGAVGDDDGSQHPHAPPGDDRRRGRRGRDLLHPHGRGRRVAPQLHPAQRQGRPLPRHLIPRARRHPRENEKT